MNAEDVMTRDVVSTSPDASVVQIAGLMLNRQVSALPVVDSDGRLVGIISEGDLMRRGEIGTEKHRSWWLQLLVDKSTLAEEYARSRAKKARDIMTREVVTATETTPIAEIVGMLEKRQIKRVPVVRDGRVVGIVSRANLLRAFASASTRYLGTVDSSDRAIRERLVAELEQQPWWTGAAVNVVVTDCVVHLWGVVDSNKERDAVRIAAENVPGMRGVQNHLTLKPVTLYHA